MSQLQTEDVVIVQSTRVMCEGSGGALGLRELGLIWARRPQLPANIVIAYSNWTRKPVMVTVIDFA